MSYTYVLTVGFLLIEMFICNAIISRGPHERVTRGIDARGLERASENDAVSRGTTISMGISAVAEKRTP